MSDLVDIRSKTQNALDFVLQRHEQYLIENRYHLFGQKIMTVPQRVFDALLYSEFTLRRTPKHQSIRVYGYTIYPEQEHQCQKNSS